MRDGPGSHPEPATSDKIHFWMGGRLPRAFSAWAEEQIRSRWFPLRRMVPIVPVIVIFTVTSLDADRSRSYLLLYAGLLMAWLAAVFVFRGRLRRRELRRYQMPGADRPA